MAFHGATALLRFHRDCAFSVVKSEWPFSYVRSPDFIRPETFFMICWIRASRVVGFVRLVSAREAVSVSFRYVATANR